MSNFNIPSEDIIDFLNKISSKPDDKGNIRNYEDELRELCRTHYPGKSMLRIVGDILNETYDDLVISYGEPLNNPQEFYKKFYNKALMKINYLLSPNRDKEDDSRGDFTDDGFKVNYDPNGPGTQRPTTNSYRRRVIDINNDILPILKAIYPDSVIEELTRKFPTLYQYIVNKDAFYIAMLNSIKTSAQDVKKVKLITIVNILLNRAFDIINGDTNLREKLFKWEDSPEIAKLKNAQASNGKIAASNIFQLGSGFKKKPDDVERTPEEIHKAANNLLHMSLTESKQIIITESMARLLKEEMSFTPFKFMGHIRKFLAELLADPTTAQPSSALKLNGLDKIQLLKQLETNGIIEKKMKLSDRDDDNNPKKVSMKVRYQIPKDNFNAKLEKLFNSTIGQTTSIKECTGCCAAASGGFSNSGEYDAPLTGVFKRKRKKTKQ